MESQRCPHCYNTLAEVYELYNNHLWCMNCDYKCPMYENNPDIEDDSVATVVDYDINNEV